MNSNTLGHSRHDIVARTDLYHFEQSPRGRHLPQARLPGIPQGGTVVGSNGTVFSVSYVGGTGNDVVLTVVSAVPEPSTWISGALGIAGLAFTQRRRLRKLIARRCAVGS